LTNTEIGLMLTCFSLLYGVARFGNGVLADSIKARYFMVTGLVCAALVNLVVGFTSSVVVLGVLWVSNAWFQGMGFPPCARLLTHWIHPGELATKMSVWNTSHSIGASIVVVFCSWVMTLCANGTIPQSVSLFGLDVALHPGWRWCFFLPAAVSLVGAAGLWIALRDTPSSVGLPELDVGSSKVLTSGSSKLKESGAEADNVRTLERQKFRTYLKTHVFNNPTIWILCVANFFVYTVRFGVLDWGPKLLKSSGGITLGHAAWMVAGFEIAGIVGMLVAGRVTDRVFGGRGPRTCAFCMGFCALFTLLFLLEWTSAKPSVPLSAALLAGAGFFIYGPQALTGVTAANISTKKLAGTSIGFISLFSYASVVVSGVGMGALAQYFGWHYAYVVMIGVAVAGVAVFLMLWNAKASAYGELGP
jgi:OPA family glycerol-3-phosphate transporter-like MFS transporter/OPA family sugar phosphate sensor protein UhpC-like MFS transporter